MAGEAAMSVSGPVGIWANEERCSDCGQAITSMVITDTFMSLSRHQGRALIHLGRDKGAHLHGVAIVTRDGLTLRAAVQRLWQRNRPRSFYRRARYKIRYQAAKFGALVAVARYVADQAKARR